MLQVLPTLAYGAVVVFILAVALNSQARGGWLLPAVLGAAFAAHTAFTVLQEGIGQFWINHTTNLTGNQVWFDLLIAVSLSFYLMAPRARAVGMPLLPWGIAVFATASVALLPMVARLIWLESRRPQG